MKARGAGTAISRTAAPGLAVELLDSALDLTELLVDQVIAPGLALDQASDFTKEITEISMLLMLIGRADASPAVTERARALADQIAPLARSRRVRDRVAARPSRALPQLLAHACLHQLGCRDAGFHELALITVRSSAAGAVERVPYRLLDAQWTHRLLLASAPPAAHPDPSLAEDSALRLSPIGRGVDLVGATIEDAYAFSHALPYATDFGRRPLPEWADVRWLSELADALILKALDEDDLDLLGELLLAPALLGTDWSPVQWFGWQVLLRTWRRYGFLPGPGLPPAEPDESDPETTRRVLGTVYHTTLVGGLLVATLASTGWWPPSSPPCDPARPSRATWVGVDGSTRCWQRVWHQLPSRHRAALAAVPVGVALHRAVADTDILGITGSLDSPLLEFAPSPLVSQTVELLNRLVLLVGVAG